MNVLKMPFFALWLAVNLIVFGLYGMDKRKAKRDEWRIPEKTLLLGTWLLGGVGALLGMRLFRHKTRHWYFVVSCWGGAVVSVLALAMINIVLN